MFASSIDNLRELCFMPGVKTALAFCASGILTLVGHPGSAALWLLALLICDLLLGTTRAWKTGVWRGWRITQGAFKFFRYWIAVVVFGMVDETIKQAFPYLPVSLRDTFIAYLAINETFSCVDHLAFFGMPVPEQFLLRLRGYREACLAGKWGGEERRDGAERRIVKEQAYRGEE